MLPTFLCQVRGCGSIFFQETYRLCHFLFAYPALFEEKEAAAHSEKLLPRCQLKRITLSAHSCLFHRRV